MSDSFDINLSAGSVDPQEAPQRIKEELASADAIIIGAGAGLSTSAGFIYNGQRFEHYFFDFIKAYGIPDMYSGGFYDFPTPEIYWAWWSRHIYYNRYIDAPKPVYKKLFELVKDKNYFVITTNVDHQFQRAGFDKQRLFYTQGDYGQFQSPSPKVKKVYENEDIIMQMMKAQGFMKDENGVFQVPENKRITMRVPARLVPVCPDDGGPMVPHLRSDGTFVEDEGWNRASERYSDFMQPCLKNHVLLLELGVGGNTPGIIKYPFWKITAANPKAVYACINYKEAYCPKQIEARSICVDTDIGEFLEKIS